LGWGLGGLGVLVAGAALLYLQFRPAPPAEILDRANRAWATAVQGGDVVFQKFALMINVGPVNYAANVAVWRSVDGQQVRYEMTDAQGRLIYFMLRRADQVWRSGSLDTLSLTPVSAVFPETRAQYQQELAAGQGSSFMLELAAGVDRVPTASQAACLELKCFLGDWSAEKGISLVRNKDAATPNGRMGPVVKLSFAGDPVTGEAPGWCILVVDPQTYLLAEYIDPSGNMLHVLDYRSLPAGELPPDLFTGFPAGVNTVG
jgi:hypothetical protein